MNKRQKKKKQKEFLKLILGLRKPSKKSILELKKRAKYLENKWLSSQRQYFQSDEEALDYYHFCNCTKKEG